MESKKISEKTDAVYEGRVYYPKEWKNKFYIMAVLELITLTMFMLSLLTRESEENITAIIMSMVGVILVSVVCAIGYARFEILIKEDCLFVTPMFGKKRKITFEQIFHKTIIRIYGNTYKEYQEGDKVHILYYEHIPGGFAY